MQLFLQYHGGHAVRIHNQPWPQTDTAKPLESTKHFSAFYRQLRQNQITYFCLIILACDYVSTASHRVCTHEHIAQRHTRSCGQRVRLNISTQFYAMLIWFLFPCSWTGIMLVNVSADPLSVTFKKLKRGFSQWFVRLCALVDARLPQK